MQYRAFTQADRNRLGAKSPATSPLITVARTAMGTLYLLGNLAAPNGSLTPKVLALYPHDASYFSVSLATEKSRPARSPTMTT